MSEQGKKTAREIDEQVALRAVVEGTAATTGEEFFASLVKNLSRALDVYGAWVTEYLEDCNRLRARAFWLGDRFVPDYEYALAGTPCDAVIRDSQLVHVPDRVVELFPSDTDLQEFAAVSYMGVALVDVDGRVLGNLAVVDTRPMPEDPRLPALLRVFANRAVAELHRLRAESRARERGEKLARLIDSAMDAILELDESMRITRTNPAAEQLFDGASAELVGKPFYDLLESTGDERLASTVEDLRTRGAAERYVWIAGGLAARTASGRAFAAEATLSTFMMDDRTYYTVILRDVNDRLEAELRIRSLEQQTAYLSEELKSLRRFDRIVGASPALLSVLKEVDQVASTDATVLILGETGTGKELVARAIHEASPRRAQPLVSVNGAAIPANLIESELFGHERGAFTGATQRRDGRFVMADGGTLFLDEIGELPIELQGKLLRVLQEGEVEPLGGTRVRKVDVRVIAATNRDLRAEVTAGRFREDLYYRLNVFPIRLPPLREREDDVVLLASEFADGFARRMGRIIEPIGDAERRRLRAYAWPGNVRELQNVIERAVITATAGRLNLDRALPEASEPSAASGADVSTGDDLAPARRILTANELRDLERSNILRALDACDGKVSGRNGAAERLDMNPSTLSSRMRALAIDRRRA